MKYKIAYILLIMACVVTACTDNKEEPVAPTPKPTPTPIVESVVEEQVPIGFSASIEQPATTRNGETPTPVYGAGPYSFDVGITGISDLSGSDKGFGVFAVYTGNSFYRDNPTDAEERQIIMSNQRVKTTDSGATWTYSPERYWPGNNSHVSFFAYAPYQADNAANPDFILSVPTTTTSSEGYKYFELDNGILKAPSIAWNHTKQKDLVYGVAYEDVTDVNGVKIKNAGDDYTDMRRPINGTLSWKLKHALARARFTVTNYLQYDEQLNAYNITLTDQGNGEVFEYGGDDTFEDDDGQEVSYKGFYVQLENDPYLHKYTQLERRLIITDVSFVNLNKSGNLVLMNETNGNGPVWENPTTYDGTQISEGVYNVFKLTPLNPLIGENYGSYQSAFDNMLVGEDQQLPLNAALKDVDGHPALDDRYEHYVLLMPQKYNSTSPIGVTVKYKICTYVKLEHNFSFLERPTHIPAESPESVYSKEYYLEQDNVFSISGTIRFDIEANKTYNILISLGKLLNVSYELTDWDDNHEIIIPTFE